MLEPRIKLCLITLQLFPYRGRMATITVRQLEIFSQVVKHGSFHNCARQIGVSQVAISDHIRQLEQRLGHKLIERISGGASVLPQAGKRAYAHAPHILAGMEKRSGRESWQG